MKPQILFRDYSRPWWQTFLAIMRRNSYSNFLWDLGDDIHVQKIFIYNILCLPSLSVVVKARKSPTGAPVWRDARLRVEPSVHFAVRSAIGPKREWVRWCKRLVSVILKVVFSSIVIVLQQILLVFSWIVVFIRLIIIGGRNTFLKHIIIFL